MLDLIIKEHKSYHLVWLQKLLLECCYIKLMLKCGSSLAEADPIMEPVAYHYIYKQKSIPVVQWNNEQSTTMLYQPFVLLLHKLGIQLPADAGSIFARIPDYWTPETMFGLAKKLGPLDKRELLKLKVMYIPVSIIFALFVDDTNFDYGNLARILATSLHSLQHNVNLTTNLCAMFKSPKTPFASHKHLSHCGCVCVNRCISICSVPLSSAPHFRLL